MTRAGGGEREFWSGAERFPDLYEGEEETRIEFRRDPEPQAEPEPASCAARWTSSRRT